MESKATTQNPKDLLGIKKPSLTKIPAVAIAHESLAMMDGAEKYGAYNWREKKIFASIYIDACMRHLSLWFEGEEEAEDSGVHHLGHARACLGILLDAIETGNLADDRPVNDSSRGKLGGLLKRLSDKIAAKQEAKKIVSDIASGQAMYYEGNNPPKILNDVEVVYHPTPKNDWVGEAYYER